MPDTATRTDVDTLLSLYDTMLLIREFETTASKLMLQGVLPGFIHVSIGQEAVAAGVCSVLRPADNITSTHRGHGHCIAKGGRVGPMMAELYGRRSGYGKGRSGSMHIADPSVGILGANAIVGGGIPMAVGAALSASMRDEGDVVVAFFGEGAVAEGVFHEALNLAALWQLPIVFVCENNQYAEMTPVAVHLSADHVVDFARAYRIPSARVDGNDVEAVRLAATEAVVRARSGEGPTLLECETYRWHGHFEGDPQRYRSAEEVASWKTRDPIARLAERLGRAGVGRDELEVRHATAADAVADAVSRAEADDLAPVESLTADVYADGDAST